jgi:predicted RNA-binding Zn ribbon-like protein
MRPLFLGNNSAIDFLNTAFAPDGRPVETIGDGKSFLEWLVAADLIEPALAEKLALRFGAKALDSAAEEARTLREWARSWLSRWRARPKSDYREELAALNKLLSRLSCFPQVIQTHGQMQIAEIHHFENVQALIALVARQIALLISRETPTLIKECASSSCTLWFLDQSKAHRRRFCSPSVCGNRAKVAAFRERHRRVTPR